MSVYEKINAGEYEPNLPYPTRPAEPVLLLKKAGDLTDEEAAALPGLRGARDKAREVYQQDITAYRKASAAGIARLKRDLEEENGLSGHPQADLLWDKAWDRGHSSGLCEVALVYEDLAELLMD